MGAGQVRKHAALALRVSRQINKGKIARKQHPAIAWLSIWISIWISIWRSTWIQQDIKLILWILLICRDIHMDNFVDIRCKNDWIFAGYLERKYTDNLTDIYMEITVDMLGYHWISRINTDINGYLFRYRRG